MKLKGLLKKTGVVFMSAVTLCAGAAVLPQIAYTGIEAQAAGNSFKIDTNILLIKNYVDSM